MIKLKDLEIKYPIESFLTNISYNEIINKKNLDYLCKICKNYEMLNKIKDDSIHSNHSNRNVIFNATYNLALSGRLVLLNNTGLSLLSANMRHALQDNNYVEIDIVNCHPNILLNILKLNNLDNYPTINRLCNEKDELLNKINNIYSINNYTKAKRILLSSFYDDNTFFIKNKECIELDFLKELRIEIAKIKKIIIYNNPDILNLVKTKTINEIYGRHKQIIGDIDGENVDIDTIIYSIFLQNKERQLLEYMYLFLKEKNIINNNEVILVCDSILFDKKKLNNYNGNIIEDIKTYIKNKTDFDLDFKLKNCDTGKDILNKIKNIKNKQSHYIINRLPPFY